MSHVFGLKGIFPISLGFNCHVKVFIQMIAEVDRESRTSYALRQPFDWLGISMGAVCEVVKADYADFAARGRLEYRKRLVKDPALYVTNTAYNFIFPHDFGKNMDKTSEARFAEVEADYKRRVERWRETIESGRHILFIRLEMDDKERVVAEDTDEKKYLEEFADMMIAKRIPFTILHLTRKYKTGYDSQRRICYVRFEQPPTVKAIGGVEIDDIIRKNLAHIRTSVSASASSA